MTRGFGTFMVSFQSQTRNEKAFYKKEVARIIVCSGPTLVSRVGDEGWTFTKFEVRNSGWIESERSSPI